MELNKGTFLAGAAAVDITPPLGTIVNGDFTPHYANFIHDPLHAKAVVLQNEKNTIVFVVVDICAMPPAYVHSIRKAIAEKFKLNFENILISCTHTHAAGSVAEVYLTDADTAYVKVLPDLIIQSVAAAIEKLQPAKIAFGKVDVPTHVRSRRYFMDGYIPTNPVTGDNELVKTNPFGLEAFIKEPATITDPEVCYLAIKSVAGSWISILANYSLHYVGDWENGTISADYFGYFANSLKEQLNANDDFVGIMSNGTSGDINIWEFIKQENYPEQYFEKSKLIGSDIAQKVYNSLSTLVWDERPELATAYREVAFKTRKPSDVELEKAKKIVSTSDYERLVVNDEGLRMIYAREQVLLAEFPTETPFPIHAIKIGNGVIGGLAAEIFAETGLAIKDKVCTKNYFTISMASGNNGYVPTEAAFEVGGYETWRSRTSYLQTDTNDILKRTIIEMVNGL